METLSHSSYSQNSEARMSSLQEPWREVMHTSKSLVSDLVNFQAEKPQKDATAAETMFER